MENKKPGDKGDYGITPTEEEKERLAGKEGEVQPIADAGQENSQENGAENGDGNDALESGDNDDQRKFDASIREQQQKTGRTVGGES